VAPRHQAIGGKIRGTTQLDNTLGNLIRMELFLGGML